MAPASRRETDMDRREPLFSGSDLVPDSSGIRVDPHVRRIVQMRAMLPMVAARRDVPLVEIKQMPKRVVGRVEKMRAKMPPVPQELAHLCECLAGVALQRPQPVGGERRSLVVARDQMGYLPILEMRGVAIRCQAAALGTQDKQHEICLPNGQRPAELLQLALVLEVA